MFPSFGYYPHSFVVTKVDDSSKTDSSRVTYGNIKEETSTTIKCHISPLKYFEIPIKDNSLENKNLYKVVAPISNQNDVNEFSKGTYNGKEYYVYKEPLVYTDILPHIEFIIVENKHG